MYNLVISEKSPSLLKDIKKIIQDNFEDIKILGCYNNNREVIELLKGQPVDIAILSVDYNGCSGIDVAKYIFDHKLDTVSIVTVNQHRFDNLKKAIDYNVLCLLEKPLYSKDIINAVLKAKNKVYENLNKVYKENNAFLLEWEYKRQTLSLVYNSKIGINELFQKNITVFKQLPLSECSCAEVTVSAPSCEKAMEKQRFYKTLKDISEGETETFSAFQVDEQNYTVSYIVFASNLKTGVENFTNHLKHSMKVLYNTELSVKINYCENIKELLRARKNSEIITAYLKALASDNAEDVVTATNRLTNEKDPEIINEILEEINKRLINDYGIDIALSDIRKKHTKSEKALIEVLSKAEQNLSAKCHLVVRMKEYIYNNFSNNLTIDSIASEFNVSSSYAGRIFKEETGQKLIDFLIDVKFEKAKEYLSTGNYSVKQVARLVGYSQIKYFSVVFKKRTGLTPSDYAKQKKWLSK